MEPEPIDQVVRNIDQRLAKVEQILPTLATKTALAETVALLATKAELAAAIAPLATKAELAETIREEGKRTRRHFDVVAESLRADIKLLAEGITGVREQHDRRLETVEKGVAGKNPISS